MVEINIRICLKKKQSKSIWKTIQRKDPINLMRTNKKRIHERIQKQHIAEHIKNMFKETKQ